MSPESFIQTVRLETSPPETWANTILYRLAIALGVAKAGDGTIQIDPDVILEQAIEHIEAWRDDRCFGPTFVSDQTLTDPVDQIVYTGNVPYGMAAEHLTDEL